MSFKPESRSNDADEDPFSDFEAEKYFQARSLDFNAGISVDDDDNFSVEKQNAERRTYKFKNDDSSFRDDDVIEDTSFGRERSLAPFPVRENSGPNLSRSRPESGRNNFRQSRREHTGHQREEEVKIIGRLKTFDTLLQLSFFFILEKQSSFCFHLNILFSLFIPITILIIFWFSFYFFFYFFSSPSCSFPSLFLS